jgi:hypothetical protein
MRNLREPQTVGNRQQFLSRSFQPPIPSSGLTLRAMAIAAGKKLDVVVRTVITLFEARAESGGTTGADVSENFALRRGERVSPAGEEFPSVLTKDIGHFQPMLDHDCGSLSPVV